MSDREAEVHQEAAARVRALENPLGEEQGLRERLLDLGGTLLASLLSGFVAVPVLAAREPAGFLSVLVIALNFPAAVLAWITWALLSGISATVGTVAAQGVIPSRLIIGLLYPIFWGVGWAYWNGLLGLFRAMRAAARDKRRKS